jgi:acyl-CoA synthetase (AMP-forming)/AMP-acid ligase II
MNCVRYFVEYAQAHPSQVALWMPSTGPVTYGELLDLSARAQAVCRDAAVGPGDTVVLADQAGPTLYAALVAVLSSGGTVVLVEPWLPISRVTAVVQQLKPKLFFSGRLGKVWGMAIPALRRIRDWADTREIPVVPTSEPLHLEGVDPSTAGIITFTSGTTGKPKGVVRTHGNMHEQAHCFSDCLNPAGLTGPDLCIFPNFALPNLVAGRTTVLVPNAWRTTDLQKLDQLPGELAPESLSCGPTFLSRLMEVVRLPSLRTINLLGATSDCSLLKEGLTRWPDAQWQHAYGSSEALPVASTDAREALAESEGRGFFQVLCLGRPIPHISFLVEEDGVWVTGGSVCGEYYGNAEANRQSKRRDSQGKVWHYMGDRIQRDEQGRAGERLWWYAGRSQQKVEDFELEQRIFAHIRSSRCFVHRDEQDRLDLYGLNVSHLASELRNQFPDLHTVVELKELVYDRRHRARLDRGLSLRRGRGGLVKWVDTARTWIDWFVH